MLTAEKLLNFDLFKPKGEIYEIFRLITEIQSTHSVIVELPSFPHVPDAIIRSELIRAVGSTTAIEGNPLTPEQIEEAFKKADSDFKLNRQEQEVQNSREVYRFLVERVAEYDVKTLSRELLRQIHTITTRGLPYPANKPGQLRNSQVQFGDPPMPSLFPDQASVENAVDKFIDWCTNTPGDSMESIPFIKALIAHYYATEIHPFFDGNGRTARALEAFCLLAEGVIHENFFYVLANFWSRNRDRYLSELRGVRQTSSVVGFVKFGLEGLLEELRNLKASSIEKITRLMFLDYVHYLQRSGEKKPNRVTARMVGTLECLVNVGRVSVKEFLASPQVRGLYRGVSESTRSRDFKKLRENRLIKGSVDNGVDVIEPNFSLLAGLVYRA